MRRFSGENIFNELASGKLNKEIVDIINANTYADPRLEREIDNQNKDPRIQGVCEAVANGLDALGFEIGQFGKGNKQNLKWLFPTGEDRIDVFTKEAQGAPYQLTIMKSPKGQNYIQIKRITEEAFKQQAQLENAGTMEVITTKNEIPKITAGPDDNSISREEIVEAIHKRFPVMDDVIITTQMSDEPETRINNFGSKEIIVGNTEVINKPEAQRFVKTRLSEYQISVTDNGIGMGSQTLLRMFIPSEGAKHPAVLKGESAKKELKKVKLIQDKSSRSRIAFSRNREVVFSVDIKPEIIKEAVAEGELIIECGRLLDVFESRDRVHIPSDLKPGEISNFQMVIDFIVEQIVQNKKIPLIERIKYINAVVIGMEGIIKDNDTYAFIVGNIRDKTKRELKAIEDELAREGYVFLPYEAQFKKIAVPQGEKDIIFMNKYLFDWQAVVSLKKLGGVILSGLTAGDEEAPLVAIGFTPESINPILEFDPDWDLLLEDERLPVIKTDKFIAIPSNLIGVQALIELNQRRRRKKLTEEEHQEFASLIQRINILTAKEVVTSYEIAGVRENLRVEELNPEFTQSKGEIDSDAINGFLTNPPVIPGAFRQPAANNQPPQDANQKIVLLKNGDLVMIGTGEKIFSEEEKIEEVEALGNSHYRIRFKIAEQGEDIIEEAILRIDDSGDVIITKGITISLGERFVYSYDRRFVCIQRAGEFDEWLYDLQQNKTYDLSNGPEFPAGRQGTNFGHEYYDIQFSQNGKYLTYIEIDKQSKARGLIVVKTNPQEKVQVIGEILLDYSSGNDIEYSINPFANVVFLRRIESGRMFLVDLEQAGIVGRDKEIKCLHTDSTGAYTVIIDANQEITIYLNKAKKILTAGDFSGIREIISVSTYWKDGKAYYRVTGNTIDSIRKSCDFYENGSISYIPCESDYFEEIRKDGKIRVFSNLLLETKDAQIIIVEKPRLEDDAVYKHPVFELFIYKESNSKYKKAIDPRTGEDFIYDGEIIGYGQDAGTLNFYCDGEIYLKSVDGMSHFKGIVDNAAARFVISAIVNQNNWALVDFSTESKQPHLLSIDSTYEPVCFDGKYFVFVNYDANEMAYLNPEHPDKPVFVFINPPEAETYARPADAPNKFVIISDEQGYYLFDTELRQKASIAYSSLKQISNTAFIAVENNNFPGVIYTDNGKAKIYYLKQGEITACSDNLIITEDKGRQSVFLKSKLSNIAVNGKIDISASGRFCVHQDSQGSLYYYESESKMTTIDACPLACKDDYEQYLVSEQADVVILKHGDKYGLFDLKHKRKWMGYEHIEINSAGNFAITKMDKLLGYIDLINGHNYDNLGPRIWMSVDVFGTGNIVISDTDNYQDGYIIDYFNGGMLQGTFSSVKELNTNYLSEIMMPIVEKYDLEKKGIELAYDNVPFGSYLDNIVYAKESPVNPYRGQLILSGDKVVMYTAKGDNIVVVTELMGDNSFPDRRYYINDSKLPYKDFSLSFLSGGEYFYRADQSRRRVFWMQDQRVDDTASFVDADNKYIISRPLNEKDKYYLNDYKGNCINISGKIPAGYTLSDVNGKYFVFYNSQIGQTAYFDPKKAAFFEKEEENTEKNEDESRQAAVDLWKQVLAKRDGFINQIRLSYQPFIELIPEEFRDSLPQQIKSRIKKLYKEQEAEIRKQYEIALQQGRPDLDWQAALPFDSFSQKMRQFMELLPEYLNSQQPVLVQESQRFQKDYYARLFSALFDLSMDTELNADASNDLFEILAFGWGLDSQRHLEIAPVISDFVRAVREASRQNIKISEVKNLVEFLAAASLRKDTSKNYNLIVREQVVKILEKKPEVRNLYLSKLCKAFKDTEYKLILDSLEHPDTAHSLGQAREFVIFLSNEVEELETRERFVPEGEDIILEAEIELSRIKRLEQIRPKKGDGDDIMGMEYLLENINKLPALSENQEIGISRDITSQRESGAYTAEIAQNSGDAGSRGLLVSYYLQEYEGRNEFVEESVDDGPGAQKEVALLIDKSTKADANQMELAGFFGTGKRVVYEGIDRLELINKNQQRAYMLSFIVREDSSGRRGPRLVGIRKLTDNNLKQGLTVRRIKFVENTIPELDRMLACRAWKTFTGLAQNDHFKIYFITKDGKKELLKVEHEILAESDFILNGINYGKFRIIAAKDMPVQVINKAGFRNSPLPDEYTILIAASLKRHIGELNLIFQIPLPVIRNRGDFQDERKYLPVIRKYSAIEFHKILAYKALTQVNPQFVFDGLPSDWETARGYHDSINGPGVIGLAEKINRFDYANISERELKSIAVNPVELVLLLEVLTDRKNIQQKTSLLQRRLAIQAAVNREYAQAQKELLNAMGFTLGENPPPSEIPYYEEKIKSAQIYSDSDDISDLKFIAPEKFTPRERQLSRLALSVGKLVGIEQVILLSDVEFSANFRIYKGKKTMFINNQQADMLGKAAEGIYDDATDTVIHEPGHLLQEEIKEKIAGREDLWETGYIPHSINFTHQPVGMFADAMKYVAAISLANYEPLNDVHLNSSSPVTNNKIFNQILLNARLALENSEQSPPEILKDKIGQIVKDISCLPAETLGAYRLNDSVVVVRVGGFKLNMSYYLSGLVAAVPNRADGFGKLNLKVVVDLKRPDNILIIVCHKEQLFVYHSLTGKWSNLKKADNRLYGYEVLMNDPVIAEFMDQTLLNFFGDLANQKEIINTCPNRRNYKADYGGQISFMPIEFTLPKTDKEYIWSFLPEALDRIDEKSSHYKRFVVLVDKTNPLNYLFFFSTPLNVRIFDNNGLIVVYPKSELFVKQAIRNIVIDTFLRDLMNNYFKWRLSPLGSLMDKDNPHAHIFIGGDRGVNLNLYMREPVQIKVPDVDTKRIVTFGWAKAAEIVDASGEKVLTEIFRIGDNQVVLTG